jgi:two-component system sensor histidine kinase HydH
MLKWILNKGLRFQIILILLIVLIVPAGVLTWSIVFPSKASKVYRTMQEDRQSNLLIYIDEDMNRELLYSLNQNKADSLKQREELTLKLKYFSRTVREANLGIYLPKYKKTYTFGNIHNNSTIIPQEQLGSELLQSLDEVARTEKDKVQYLKYRNREILMCFHAIKYNSKVTAVSWVATVIPPEFSYERPILAYIGIFGPAGLIIGLILMIIIVNNSNKNIYKIGRGLELMSSDLSYRLEPMEGDIGKVAKSINIMANSLEKKERLEEQLKRSEKLASLGQMISGVAHEIRNPLSIIRGTVQLMEKNFKNVDGLEEYVKIVKEQSDRENNVIQELLDYARPSKQVMMSMDINVLIKGVLSFTNKYIGERRVRLNLELEEEMPELLMDCDKIKQIFVNMILNACEAMETGGTLSIRTEKDDRWVRIYFEDTGVGMDESEMKKIFNPYYTTKPKGTGLGLAISNGIVEMHGGYIKVTSKKGVGSNFVVELPISNTCN